MKRFAVLLIVVIALLVTFVSVYAVPPIRERVEYTVTQEIVDCSEVGPWDFKIFADSVGNILDHYFFDKDGNMIRNQWHDSGVSYLYVEGYPEDVVSGNYSYTIKVFFDPQGAYAGGQGMGIVWNIQLPGHGQVYRTVVSYSIDENRVLTRLNLLAVEDYVTLCGYFAE